MTKSKPVTLETIVSLVPDLASPPEAPASEVAAADDPQANPVTLPEGVADELAEVALDGQPEAPASDVAGADDPQADPASQPEGVAEEPAEVAPLDPVLLRKLIDTITEHNTDAHRRALMAELESVQSGARVETRWMVLAGVEARGDGTLKSLLANWCNAARRALLGVANA